MTTSFSDLLREQEEVAGWIQRFWANVCKLGKDKLTGAVLEQRQGLLNRYWDTFLSGHRKLMRCKEASSSSYVKEDAFSVTEEAYLDAASMISHHLKELPSPCSSHVQQSNIAPPPHPQLPKIDLPKFSGDPLQWESFRDLFKSLVHDVSHLPDVQKLLYLKSSLTGEAAEVIRNTPITDSGFRGAWDDLEARYGNIRLLSFSHHRALLLCPPALQQSAGELKRLLDTFRQAIRAYVTLRKPVTSWDEWFVYLLSQKLDKTTHLAWETSLADSREIPRFQQLSQFLENRIQALGAAGMTDPSLHAVSPTSSKEIKPKTKGGASAKGVNSNVLAAASKSPPARKCPGCSGTHGLGFCYKFKALSPAKRKERVQQLKACLSCLNVGHEVGKCPSKQVCLACSKRHHTLLHEALTAPPASAPGREGGQPAREDAASTSDDATQQVTTLSLSVGSKAVALLATAKVRLEAPSGETVEVRALLDTGSDTSLVSSWVAQALRLPRRAVRVAISGVKDNEVGHATGEVSLVVRPRHPSDFRLPVRALVLRKLTSLLPSKRIVAKSWPHITGLTLADPEYGVPARVDLLLGADVCGTLFGDDSRRGPEGTPTAKLTPFGWVLMGPASDDKPKAETAARVLHCHGEDSTSQLLQRFWELDEIRERAPMSQEEEKCERHFLDTHARDPSGRYVVRLPFVKDPRTALKSNRTTALKLLFNCERRLSSDATLKEQYRNFMMEYLTLQHMQGAPEEADKGPAHYLPHHAVRKRHDPSAKLRVVFNASFCTATGQSLNDCLATGQKLQADLWMVLTRWRLFRVVFTTDIVKMFRQIRVHSEDTKWQSILWRATPDERVQDFRLTTVTYGTACAPFLALRVLAQLANDESSRFPRGASVVRRHTYVDDILTGADDVSETLALKREVVAIFKAGGFELSKWASNIPEIQEADSSNTRLFQEWSGISTLGVNWNPRDDAFSLRVAAAELVRECTTKRSILSEIAGLFDPLGWAAPVLVVAKILMQDLWILGADWDQQLPENVCTMWQRFRGSLPQLDTLKIPRWTFASSEPSTQMELHGFCDASQRAYAAAVYLRVNNNGLVTTSLLVAKTKVAPVKTITIPKLELCGATLLSKLLIRVKEGINMSGPTIAWTDSSVTLHWIRGHASQWKPFVAHRVSDIQHEIPADNWRHIRSPDNPADLATRGMSPAELVDSDIWWHGPKWLTEQPEFWPATFPESNEGIEAERRGATVHVVKEKLQHLQQFPKWRRYRENLEIGSLALIRDDLQPPAKWLMGRVTELHPGPDGCVRVVTLRTEKGTVKRPIVKLCPLPVSPTDAS
uniref:uncharacterized protein LOC117611359 n=1 Tax=Osmia lignaria TaxID=473952 RepID=UPI001478B0E0|nr:uncharacterized protein LOC117611359 [Osmia lignaria]